MQEYLSMWKNAFVFEGRSRRKDFWMAVLFNMIASFAIAILSFIPVIGAVFKIVSLLYSIAILIPMIALWIRRLHDTNKSG